MEEEIWNLFCSLREKHQSYHGAMGELDFILLNRAMELSKDDKGRTNQVVASKMLGLKRSTFSMKIQRYGIQSSDVPSDDL
jgi:DNA-binding protein Fis